MKLNNIFYAVYPNNGKQYIFELPSLEMEISKGERLSVHCVNGDQIVRAASHNFVVPRQLARATAKAMGGYFPLAKATGRVVQKTVDAVEAFEENTDE